MENKNLKWCLDLKDVPIRQRFKNFWFSTNVVAMMINLSWNVLLIAHYHYHLPLCKH